MEMDSADEIIRPSFLLKLLPMLHPKAGRTNKRSSTRMDLDVYRVKRISTYINCNYSRKIVLEELARYVAMSKAGLCVFYKKMTGETIGAGIAKVRLEKACELLRETKMSVSAIAYASAYSDSSHLIRAFRSAKACTPQKWRLRGTPGGGDD